MRDNGNVQRGDPKSSSLSLVSDAAVYMVLHSSPEVRCCLEVEFVVDLGEE